MIGYPLERTRPTYPLEEVFTIIAEGDDERIVISKHKALAPARDVFKMTRDGIKETILCLERKHFKVSRLYEGQIDWQDSYLITVDQHDIYKV